MPAGASEDFFLFCAVEIDSLLLFIIILTACSPVSYMVGGLA